MLRSFVLVRTPRECLTVAVITLPTLWVPSQTFGGFCGHRFTYMLQLSTSRLSLTAFLCAWPCPTVRVLQFMRSCAVAGAVLLHVLWVLLFLAALALPWSPLLCALVQPLSIDAASFASHLRCACFQERCCHRFLVIAGCAPKSNSKLTSAIVCAIFCFVHVCLSCLGVARARLNHYDLAFLANETHWRETGLVCVIVFAASIRPVLSLLHLPGPPSPPLWPPLRLRPLQLPLLPLHQRFLLLLLCLLVLLLLPAPLQLPPLLQLPRPLPLLRLSLQPLQQRRKQRRRNRTGCFTARPHRRPD